MNKLTHILKKYNAVIVSFVTVSFGGLLSAHSASAGVETALGSALNSFLMTGLSTAAKYVGIVILWGSSLFVYIAGQGLDFIVRFSVVKMGWVMSGLPGLETVWLMARDATNLIFIFMLIYTGILMIIDANLLQKRGMLNYRRMLVMLVVAALLVNFSLFFTRAAVDISNVVATKLYSLSNQQSLSVVLMNSMSAVKIATNNSLPKFDQAALTIESSKELANTTSPLGEGVGMLLRGIFGGIILIVAGLSFLAISFFLLLRFVLVLYLLLTSPFYFAGLVWPTIRNIFGDWLRTLVSQCLFPIVYFLFLLMILFFIVGGTDPTTGENIPGTNLSDISGALYPSEAAGSKTNANLEGAIGMSFSQLLQFVLIIAGLIGSLKISVSISNKGASGIDAKIRQYAGKGSNYLTRRAFNVAGGVAGVAAAPLTRIPLVGKPLVGMAGGIGKAAGYGVNQFGKVTGTGDLTGAMVAGTAAGFGTMRDVKPIDAYKKMTALDPKKVEERLAEQKKELEKGVDAKNEARLATATADLKKHQLSLDRAQQAFRNAKTDAEKAAALDEESRAEERRDAAQEELGKINKEISRDKKIAVAEWRSNSSGGIITRTRRSIRRATSATERAAISKSALESPKESKEQLTEKADRVNVRLANMIDTGKNHDEIIAYLRDKKSKITPAVMALIKPSLLVKKVAGSDVSPIVEFMTPSMLTAFSREEKGGASMVREDLQALLAQLEERAKKENAIKRYLEGKESDWLPKTT